jgi:hypothetical protein
MHVTPRIFPFGQSSQKDISIVALIYGVDALRHASESSCRGEAQVE